MLNGFSKVHIPTSLFPKIFAQFPVALGEGQLGWLPVLRIPWESPCTPKCPAPTLHRRPQEHTAEGGPHPVCTAGEMGTGLGRAGQAAGQASWENDHPDACQHRRTVAIMRQILKVWKKRTCGCPGNYNTCRLEESRKPSQFSIVMECSHPRLPSVWSLVTGEALSQKQA